MLKNLLVPLTGFDNDRRSLEAAFLLGFPFRAHIEALHVKPAPIEIVLSAALRQFGSGKGNRELVLALTHEAESRAALARQAFDRFVERHSSAADGAQASFRQKEGSPVDDTLAEARYFDLLVLGRAPENGRFTVDELANLLVGSGRPLLVVPDQDFAAIGEVIAVAWKDKAEAARAVTAAMPLLARAKKILVLTVAERGAEVAQSTESAEHLARQLSRHGFSCQAFGLSATDQNPSAVLLNRAKDLGADLVVMGAYSHSRMRELVFGGFTRNLLEACELPLFLLH